MEIWKDIPDYEGLYQVSNLGRVKGLIRGKILKQSILTNGYLNVWLSKDGRVKIKRVHRLVAMAFIPNPDNKPQVNHIDKDVTNNCVNNLEWVTASENQMHSYRFGRNFNIKDAHKANCKKIRVYKDNAFLIQYNSIRECADNLGINAENIRQSIKNHWKQYRGYKFELI